MNRQRGLRHSLHLQLYILAFFSSLDLQLQMSGCLVPPLSVYPSPLVIYSSPLVIYSCCLLVLGAFMTGLFTCFIHVIFSFLSISEHFAKIFPSEVLVLFLYMLFQPIFCMSHTLAFFHGSYSSCDFLNFIFIVYVILFF